VRHCSTKLRASKLKLKTLVSRQLSVTGRLFFGLLVTYAIARAQTAQINGVVKDPSGLVVSGAAITVTQRATGAVRNTTSGSGGRYVLPDLPIGPWLVEVVKEGFVRYVEGGIILHVGDAIPLNFTLQIGPAKQEISVQAGAPLIDTESGSLGGLVNDQQISELPLNGRNYIDLSLQQAGVSENKNNGMFGGMIGTVFSSDGAPTISNNFLLDGTSLVNQTGWDTASMAGTTLGLDGIQEYRVVTNAFAAEYGMTMGSQLLMVSKSGSNQFHGTAFDYLRNNDLDARNFFDPLKIPAFHRNNFGGSIGAPIRRNKTFFFGVYEGLKQIQGFTVGDVVPGAGCHGPAGAIIWNGMGTPAAGAQPTGCPQLGTNPAGAGTNSVTISPVTAPLLALYPNPTNPAFNGYTFPTSSNTLVNFGQMRVDQGFSGTDTFFARVTVDTGNVDSPSTSAFTAFNGVAFPEFRGNAQNRNVFATVSETHIFSPTLLNSARLSFSRTNFTFGDYTAQPLNTPPLLVGATELGSVSLSGYSGIGFNGAAGPPPPYHIQNIKTFSDDLFHSKSKHGLKFGTLINQYNEAVGAPLFTIGSISYGSVANFLQGIPTTYSALVPGSDTERYWTYETLGFYAQDNWHATNRLTVDLGIRYEFMTSPQELHNLSYALRDMTADASATQGPVMRNRTLLNFSPRAGFAWDVFGNAHTSVHGGYGIYYDIGSLGGAFLDNAAGTPPLVSSFTISNQTTNSVVNLPFTFNPEGVGHTADLIDYNAYQPHVAQYNLTVEQRLPGSIALSVAYAGSRGAHLWTEKEGNPAPPTYVSPSGVKYWATTVPTCASAFPSCRDNPNFTSILLDTTAGDSWYNALQVSLNKRVSKGLEFQTNYTWSHSIDTTEGQIAGSDCSSSGMDTGTDPTHPSTDRGPSCFDIRQNLRFNVIYHLPAIKGSTPALKVLDGWWVGSIVAVQSGYPFSPTVASNRSQSAVGAAASDRVNIGTAIVAPGQAGPDGTVNTAGQTFVPFNPNTVITGNPNEWFNPLMFSLPPLVPCPNNPALTCGTLGDAARGLFRGPSLTQWDFSLVKDTVLPFISERSVLQFRAEFFNILNHANFAMPIGTVFAGSTKDVGAWSESPVATVGQITSTATSSRQIQVALKLIF